MYTPNSQNEIASFQELCGQINKDGKISPNVDSISRIIQIELLRIYGNSHPISQDMLSHVDITSYQNFLKSYLEINQIDLNDFFSPKVIQSFVDQVLETTSLENNFLPGYLFFIFPIPFDQNIRPLNKEDLDTADNLKILILENKDAKASYTIYRGTYLHKILPSEF